jgi:hypothetical protein
LLLEELRQQICVGNVIPARFGFILIVTSGPTPEMMRRVRSQTTASKKSYEPGGIHGLTIKAAHNTG